MYRTFFLSSCTASKSIRTLHFFCLRCQIVEIEVFLFIAVSMYTGNLREDVIADDRFVVGNAHAGIALHHFAHAVEFVFGNIRFELQLVVDQRRYTGNRRISGTFAQTVDGHAFVSPSRGRTGERT